MTPTVLEGKVIEGYPYNNQNQKTDFRRKISGVVIGKNLVTQDIKKSSSRTSRYIPVPAYLIQTDENEICTILALDTIQCLPTNQLEGEKLVLTQVIHNISRNLPSMHVSIPVENIQSCLHHLRQALESLEE